MVNTVRVNDFGCMQSFQLLPKQNCCHHLQPMRLHSTVFLNVTLDAHRDIKHNFAFYACPADNNLKTAQLQRKTSKLFLTTQSLKNSPKNTCSTFGFKLLPARCMQAVQR